VNANQVACSTRPELLSYFYTVRQLSADFEAEIVIGTVLEGMGRTEIFSLLLVGGLYDAIGRQLYEFKDLTLV